MHTFRLNIITAAALALLLLGAQLATAAHGVEHPFHEHQSWCDSFLAADHNSSHCAVAAGIKLLPAITATPFPAASDTPVSVSFAGYRSRAPPAH